MNVAVILSGGIGSRMKSDIPKQYIEIDNRPILFYCLEKFIKMNAIDAVVVVVANEWQGYVERIINKLQSTKPIWYAPSGETRQYSIFNGLKESEKHGIKDNDIVIIHEAARPLVSKELIHSCLSGCEEFDGVLPVIPVKDTIYQSSDGVHIDRLLKRNELFAGQAPEAFRFGKYLKIHKNMSREELLKINGSTEIAYKGEMSIKLIRGDEMNFKITTPEDLSNFQSIISKTK